MPKVCFDKCRHRGRRSQAQIAASQQLNCRKIRELTAFRANPIVGLPPILGTQRSHRDTEVNGMRKRLTDLARDGEDAIRNAD